MRICGGKFLSFFFPLSRSCTWQKEREHAQIPEETNRRRIFISSSGQNDPSHTWFCDDSWETPEWYSLSIASRKPFFGISRTVSLPHLDLKPPDTREEGTALYSVLIRMLCPLRPRPQPSTFSVSSRKGLEMKRAKEWSFVKVSFLFFFLPLPFMNKIGWCFQRSKAVMHKCPSASLYGMSAETCCCTDNLVWREGGQC